MSIWEGDSGRLLGGGLVASNSSETSAKQREVGLRGKQGPSDGGCSVDDAPGATGERLEDAWRVGW